MFDDENWKEVGDNLFLSRTGVLAMSDGRGGKTCGWIKKPEPNAGKNSYSYRYRPVAGKNTRRVRCDELVKQTFGISILCDDDWFESICCLCSMNSQKRKATRRIEEEETISPAMREEEMSIVEIALKTYPHPKERQVDFWSGF